MAIAAAFPAAHAQQIVPSGQTATGLAVNGNVTDVTTGTTSGQNAFNSFRRFDVDAGNVVNLHLPDGTSNLINVVLDRTTQIDGVLNSVKGGQVGGNVYFANPHGVIVGERGVVNVGSLHLSTPTPEFAAGLVSPAGVPDPTATGQLLAGQIPVSATAPITVRGTINVAGDASIAAGQVANSGTIRSGAVFATARVDFADVVNVAGLQTAAALTTSGGTVRIAATGDLVNTGVVSADGADGVGAGRVELRAGGDIALAGDARVSASGRGAGSAGGEVIVVADRDAVIADRAVLAANGGEVSGDGGFVEFSARRTVTLAGGSLQAAATDGEAGTVLIDPENLVIGTDLLRAPGGNASADGVTWDAGSLVLEAEDTLTVSNGVVVSTRDVGSALRADHVGGMSLGPSGNLTLQARQIVLEDNAQLLAQGSGNIAGGSILLDASASGGNLTFGDVVAGITLGAATIKGGSVTLQAGADYTTTLVPIVVRDVTATIDLNGSLVEAAGALVLSATAWLDSVTPGLLPAETVDGLASATVDVRGDSVLRTTGGAASLSATATLNAGVEAGLPDVLALPFDAGVGVVLADGIASVRVRDTAELDIDGALTLAATNTVTTSAVVDASASGASAAGGSAAVAVINAVTEVLVEADALISRATSLVMDAVSQVGTTLSAVAATDGASFQGTDAGGAPNSQTEQFLGDYGDQAQTGDGGVQVAAAVAVSDIDSTTRVRLGSSERALVTGAVTLGSQSAVSADITADGSTAAGGVGVGVGVAINLADVVNEAIVDQSLDAAGLTLTAGINPAATGHAFSSAAVSGAGASDVGVAGSLAVNVVSADSAALLGAAAAVDAGGGAVLLQADNVVESSASATPADGGATGETLGIGASVAVNVASNAARAELADGAGLDGAGSLSLLANGSFTTSTEAEAGSAGGIALTPVVAVTLADNRSIARIGSGLPLVLAGELLVEASHTGLTTSQAQAEAAGDKVAIGASVAVNVASDVALATTLRDVESTGGGITFRATSAAATDASAKASAKGGKEETEGETPEDGVDQEVGKQLSVGQGQQKGDSANQSQQPGSAETSEGKVSVAAAVAVNVADSTASAYIGDGRMVTADGALALEARNDTDATATADGSSAGSTATVGIGAAVAVNKVTADTGAWVGDADVTADGVTVTAGMNDTAADGTNTIAATASSGAGGGKVGIAGALALNLIDVRSTATLRTGAGVDADGGNLLLSADGATSASAEAKPTEDGGASGGEVGVGASAAVNVFSVDQARAAIEQDATVTNANAVTLTATSDTDSTAEAEADAEGSIAIDAVVAFTQVRQAAEAVIAAGADLVADGLVSLTALATGDHGATATGDVKSGKVGVGASAAVITSDTSTRAALERNLEAGSGTGDALTLTADASRSYEAVAFASAAGSKAEDEISQDDKDQAKSTSTLQDNQDSQQGTQGGSKVNVAAAAGVLVLDDDVEASIGGGAQVTAYGGIELAATNAGNFSARGRGDTLDITKVGNNQQVGIGVGVGLAIVRNDTLAEVGAGARIVEAGDVAITATSTQNRDPAFANKLAAEGVSGAGSEKVSVAGSLAVANSNATTVARLGDGVIVDEAGAITITADNTSKLSAKAWSGALSNKVGVGASVATVVSENTYRAAVGANANVTAGSLSLAARNNKVTGSVPFDFEFSLDGASADSFETKFSEQNLQLLLGENNYYTEALAGAGGGQVAVTGAFAVNVFDDTTEAVVGDDATVTATGAVDLEATNETTAKAFAGALAVGRNAGVGLNSADIVNRGRTAATLGTGARILDSSGVTLDAATGLDFGVFGASLGLANTAGVAGVLALVLADNEVVASTGADSVLVSRGDATLQASSDYRSLMVAGGAGGGNTAGVGASAATNQVETRVRAEVGAGADVRAAGTLTVDAAATETTKTIAVAGGAASTAGVGAGVTVNLIDPEVRSLIAGGARVNVDANDPLLRGERVLVQASGTTDLLSIAGGVGAASTAGIGAGVDVGVVTRTVEAYVDAGAEVRASEEVRVEAAGSETIFSIGAGAGAGQVGLAGAAAGHSLTTETKAYVAGGATVDSLGNVVVAADGVTDLSVIAGGAALGGTVGIGLSAGVVLVDKLVEAWIGEGASVTALGAGTAPSTVATGYDVGFSPYDPARSDEEVQGPAASQFDAEAVAAGGDLLTKQRTAQLATGAIRGLAVTATSRDEVKAIAVAGGIAGTVAVTFGGAVGVLDSRVSARIEDGALINNDNTGANADQSVLVAAGHDLYHLGLGGAAAGAGVVGAGAGADVMVIDLDTSAWIGSQAQVRARRDVDVTASSRQDLLSVAGAAAAGGTVGLAGAVGVAALDSATQAWIGDDAFVDADGNVRVAASDDTQAILVAGSVGIGIGAVGVGGSVGVTTLDKDTAAWVGAGATVNARGGVTPLPDDTVVPSPGGLDDVEGIEDDPGTVVPDPQEPPPAPDTTDRPVYSGDGFDATTLARGLLVQATSSEDLLAIAAAGSGGLFAGVSGAVTVENIRSVTRAWIDEGALINVANDRANARQDVNVTARNDAKLLVIDGSLAVGPLGAGVAGSVDVGLIRNDTSAWIGAGAEVNANRDIDVNALARKDIDSYVISAAGGIVGVAAGVGVYSVGAALDADSRGRLQPEDSDDTANAYADDQAGDGTVTGALGNFGNARLASIGSEAGARRGSVSISDALATAPPSGTAAWVGEGAVLNAGRHVDVDARDDVSVGMVAGAAAVGAVSLGAGIAVATVNTNVQAFVEDDAVIAAGLQDDQGDFSLTARLDSDSSAAAYAGSGGLVALDAAAAVFNDTSTVATRLGDGVQVTSARQARVESIDRREQLAEAFGAGVGAATAGVSVATTRLGGSVTATLGNGVQVGQGSGTVGELVVVADSVAGARAEATSAKAGLGLAASGSVATATVNPTVGTTVGGDSAITTGVATNLSALAAPRAEAEAIGVNVSAGVSIGASVATATAAPNVTTAVGDDVAFGGAGSLSVLAQNRPADGTNSAFARSTGASGGALVGANATVAAARSDSDVIASLGTGVQLPAGNAIVRANNFSRQQAVGLGISLGFVAVGANDVEAVSGNTTLASAGTGLVTSPGRLGDLAVVAQGEDENAAASTAGSGGVIAGNASFAETRDTSTVTATLGGGTTLYTGALLVDAAHTSDFAPSSDSVNAAAVGASGAFARHTTTSIVGSSLGASLIVNAAGPAVVSASNVFSDGSSGERASGAAGGVASGAAVGSATTLVGNTSVTLADDVRINSGTDPVLNPGGIELVAATFLTADEQVSLVSGGLLAGAVTQTRLAAGVSNTVTVGARNQLISQGHVGAGTFAQLLATTSSLVNTYGAAAVGSADSALSILSNQTVNIGSDSLLQGTANVDITAGKDPTGFYDTLISATSSAQGYVRGLIAVPLAEADTSITSNASLTIGSGTQVRSGQNATIGAYKGTPLASADGTGRGFELGFIPVTVTDSEVAVATTANVVHNGTVTAGIYNRLELEIPDCRNSGIFCSTLNVLTQGDVAPFLSTWVPAFNPAQFVAQNFSGNSGQLLLSGVSSTPVGARTFGTLFVSGGQVTVNADSLSGSGVLTARGGPVISINNLSPNYLVLGPALIPNTPGGRVLFTGAAGRAQAGSITVNEINPGQAPVIQVANRFDGPVGTTSGGFGPALFLTGPIQNLGGLVSIENVSGSLGQVATIFGQQVQVTVPNGVAVISIPNGTYYVSGTPYDQWGGFMIWPGGNPANGRPDANQAASWAANVYARNNLGWNDPGPFAQGTLNNALYGFAGDTDNNSYSFYGFCAAFALSQGACSSQTARSLSPLGSAYAISGSDFDHRWFPVVPVRSLTSSANTYDVANLAGSRNGAAIFGGQVAIEAKYVDLNARIIAGQPTDWSVRLPGSLTAAPSANDPFGGQIYRHDLLYALGLTGPVLQLSNLPLVNATLDERIQATYDARTRQVTLANVNASSGGARVSIEGTMLSTNPLGQILVNGGLGTINVQNETGRELVLQQLNTGNTTLASALENRVQIIDKGRPSASNQWLYLYSPAAGLRVFNGAETAVLGAGTPVFTSTGSGYWFDPQPGLRWEWQLRAGMTRQVSTDSNGWVSSISGWNWTAVDPQLDANDPWRYAQVSTFNNGFLSSTTKTPTGRLVVDPGKPVFQQDITATNFGFFRQGVNYHGCGNTICNFGFRRTGTYTSGPRNGEGFANWSYRMATSATLVMTQSVKADNRIGIDFAGNPRGSISISSNAPVTVTGQLLNPNGNTSITTAGSLLSSAAGSLLTDNGILTAGGAIGSVGLPFAVTMSGNGVLNAAAGRDGLFIDVNSAVNLGSLQAGNGVLGYGDVVVRAAGNLLRAPGLPGGQVNVTGRSITLESALGSIGLFGTTGYDGTPLVIDARPTLLLNGALAGGEVTARAQTDIALREATGQFLAGTIESTASGNVFLSAPGSLLSASGQTAAQALDPDQVRQVWEDLRLTTDFGAAQPGDAAARSVQNYERLVNREYERYWQLRSRGTVQGGVFVLDADALAIYRPVTALVEGVATPSDAQVRAYAAGLYAEVTGVLAGALGSGFESLAAFQAFDEGFGYQATTAEVAELTARGVWTEQELSAAINRTALQPASGTPVGVGTPNIIGRNVVLDTGSAVGRLAEPIFIGLADLQAGNLTPAQAAALALAVTPGDVLQVGTDAAGNTVLFSFGQQPADVTLTGFHVSQTSPLFVNVTGGFRANAGGEAFIQSAGQILTLDQVIAAGDVSLTAPQSIVSAGTSPVQVVAGGDLTLLAGSGSIGVSPADPLVVDIGGRLLAASASQNVYLQAVGRDLVIGRLFAGQAAWLQATDGGIAGFLDGIVVEADDIGLFVAGDIGSLARPFVVKQRAGGQLDGGAGGQAFLLAPEGSLAIGSVVAPDGINVVSAFGLTAASLESASGPVTAAASGGDAGFGTVTAGGAVSLVASGDLDLDSAEAGGTLDIDAGGDVSVTGSVTAVGDLGVDAGGAIDVGGEVQGIDGAVTLLAGDALTVDGSVRAGGGALTATAGGDVQVAGAIEAAGDLAVDAGGGIELDGEARSGGAVMLAAVDDVRLARVVTTSTAGVTITSEQGSIGRLGTGAVPVIDAPGALLAMSAALGIGNDAPLTTRVARLDAVVTGSGDLHLANTGGLQVDRAQTADGAIGIDATGTLVATRVVAAGATGTRRSDIRLTATGGDLVAREVTTPAGDVSLETTGSLADDAAAGSAAVTGRAVTLAAGGDIGSAARWFGIDSGSEAVAPVAATAGGSIWLREVAGDLYLAGIVASAGDVRLQAPGSLVGVGAGTHVAGGIVDLESLAGSIGLAGARLVVDSTVRVDGAAATGIALEEAAGDLVSDRMATTAGSIDILVRDGSGDFGEVLAPDDVTIIANGTYLGIELLDPDTAWLAATSAGSTLEVLEAYVGSSGRFEADTILFPDLVHTGELEPLRIAATGHAGGDATATTFRISSVPGVVFHPLLTRTADIAVTGELLQLLGSRVTERGLFANARWTVLVDNVNRRLFPVDAQLYSAHRPSFDLRFDTTPRITTTALAINYQPDVQVNGFSTENSLTRLVAKLVAVVEDTDTVPVEPADDAAGPAEVAVPDGWLPPAQGEALDGPAGVRISL
ncbi:MAG: leukotoxin LktA family filamentous adhesin [Chromatiales bacterium]|nr:leukotoxin LktA family filamentous adhesin [Chromatiales bacterium]